MATILIVDDDAFLLRFAESYLRKKGFGVDVCRSAYEAWNQFQARPMTYQAVLVDVTLGEDSDQDRSSRSLARKMWDLNPTVAVLFWSGYPFSLDSMDAPQGAAIGFLQKPFTPVSLTGALERLLGVESDSQYNQSP